MFELMVVLKINGSQSGSDNGPFGLYNKCYFFTASKMFSLSFWGDRKRSQSQALFQMSGSATEEDISDVKMDRASGPPITRRILDSHTLGFVNNRNRQESDKKKKKML